MKKKQISSEINNVIFEIANTQMGYFTSQQAVSAGIIRKNHSYHIKAGHWKREMRGIYRLKNYPISDFEELMAWYLWTKNRKDIPQGIFSHDTALDLYELSDINPSKIHITVPKTFQRFNAIPSEICLHKGELKESDIKGFHGMKITTPIRTIFDLVHEGKIGAELVKQAVEQGLKRGLISKIQIDKNPEIMEYFKK
ncbi:MAG: hypothetical protein AABZ06_12155 [Bdellovibrionota bacterium]